MATGNNIRTYFEGRWHDGDVASCAPLTTAHGWAPPFLTERVVRRVGPGSRRPLRSGQPVRPGADDHADCEHRRDGRDHPRGAGRYPEDAAVYIRPMYWALDGDVTGASCRTRAPPVLPSAWRRFRWPPPDAAATLTTTRFRRPVLEDAVVNAKAGCLYPNNARMLAEARSRVSQRARRRCDGQCRRNRHSERLHGQGW